MADTMAFEGCSIKNAKIFSNIDDSDLMIKLQKFYDLHKEFLI